MNFFERFAGAAQDTRNTLLAGAALTYVSAFEMPGSAAEAELAHISGTLLVTALGVRILECCALQMGERQTTAGSE